MNKFLLLVKPLLVMVLIFVASSLFAAMPVWTFTPLTPTSLSLSPVETAVIQYQVTNQSHKPHRLGMKDILPGISASGCTATLGPKLSNTDSCILTLSISGSALKSSTIGGPVLCQLNPNGTLSSQCYRPSQNIELNISLNTTTFVVTPDDDGNVTINPNTPQTIYSGATQSFVVTANPGFTVSTIVGGNCPAGTWATNTYTTGPITANCNVVFGATTNTSIVTPSGTNVTINPNTPQTVIFGGTQTFTLTADTGYTLSNSVGGTCPAGSFAGNAYTTGPITGNCTVIFSATIDSFTVTPSGSNVSISPNTPQSVNYGSTQAFTVTADTGYTLSNSVGGTCPAGSFAGNSYTTGPITAACTVIFSATINSFTVTPSGSNVSIIPNTPQSVNYGSTQAFTVTADTGYTLSNSVGGTCPAGSFAGNSYTTGPITAACTVIFNATIDSFTVTPSGSNVSISPNSPQTVNYGSTQAFTVTANSGLVLSNTVGGTCPAGTWSANVYTTGQITSNCTVTFTSTAPFAVAMGPENIIVTPGNGQATVSWTAPSNTGTGTITGYIVTYGPTSGTTFTTPGCQTTGATSCTVTGLTNATSYIFTVKTATTLNGGTLTGPSSFSSPITPVNGLSVNPSTLALAITSNGTVPRTVTVTNTSTDSIQLTTQTPVSSDFAPALPTGTSLTATTCTLNSTLAPGQSCTLTITPGATSSLTSTTTPCTLDAGNAVQISNLTLTGNSTAGTYTAAINAVVLGYVCNYQGGNLFAIDNTAPATQSIRGKVVATNSLSTNTAWSVSSDSIWGIDNTSTPAQPSPSSAPAALTIGQLNCDAVNDGSCASTNIVVFYASTSATSYAAGQCSLPRSEDTNICSGSSVTPCYSDWYLPAPCDVFMSDSGAGINCLSDTQNIGANLGSVAPFNQLVVWSSTESSSAPATQAFFSSIASGPGAITKTIPAPILCVRNLTQ